MDNYKQIAVNTASFLARQVENSPQIAVMTGTGLGDSLGFLQNIHAIDYKDIPDFPISTVESHAGNLIFGTLGKKRLMAFQGRFHLYEGYSPRQVSFPIRVMRELGVKILILTNAAGGLNGAYSPGDIMIISDHINLTGENPLVGPNENSWGIRFPDMSFTYAKKLSKLARDISLKEGIRFQTGVYAGLKGPCLETPAEARFLQTIGADAVGFSTVQEAIAAVHGGIRVLGLSTITNVHKPDNPAPSSVAEIIQVANAAAPKIEILIKRIVEQIDDRQLN